MSARECGDLDELPVWAAVPVGIEGHIVLAVHVVPLGDLRPHVASPDCHCSPFLAH